MLDIYDNGLKVPEDVTLAWPDDNYGYIQRRSNEKEKGSGVCAMHEGPGGDAT